MSSQDSLPSSRPSLSDPPSQDAIALFDLHLKFLTDSYLSFFQERRRIEETYVESLLRLHRKVKTVDLILDDPSRGGDLNTTRAAWAEIRDNIAREADTRVAFLGTLTTDVVSPLMALKETQDRIRKRVKEDLKEAVNTHTDYSENVLPRLKRNYLKKCQDAEDYRTAAAAVASQQATGSFDPTTGSSAIKPNPNISARPIVTAPQPLRPLDRRPSVGAPSSHARSPSTSTALQDAFHQGKKGLNQLITLLDKGGNMKDLSGRSDNALRSVRAKREAEESDKEYRKGVHWLETLRLRRVKILESGYNSLESFVREAAEIVKASLVRYTDNMVATSTTQIQIAEHGRRIVEKISSEKDSALIGTNIPRMLLAAVPKPVYYYNYNVGECKDLIFGVSLVDYATARNLTEGEVPKIVRVCIKEIERRGLEAEGIYRVSGRHASVQELQHKVERNETSFMFNYAIDDVYAVASLLKLYLRELPEPLFKFPLQERIQHTEELDEHKANDFQLLRSKIRRLPPVHQATLKMIVEHLMRVASNSEKNKMDAKNLAIVFGAVIFGEDEMPKGGDLLSVQSWRDTLAEDLIMHAQTLFSSSGSPPLPSAQLVGESTLMVPHGPSHTKVPKIGPPPSPKRSPPLSRSPSLPPRPPPPFSGSRSPEDFTPQLPPHPPSSIHPSLRTGPMSALPSRQSLPVQPRTIESQMPPPLTAPLRARSRSREGRYAPRTTPRQREMSPDQTVQSKETRLTPRTTPQLPPRALLPDDFTGTEMKIFTEAGSPNERPNGQERTPDGRGDVPPLASSTLIVNSVKSSSRESILTSDLDTLPKSPVAVQSVVPGVEAATSTEYPHSPF
ncbi:uncharacterized protein FIBRA_02381 [Fibroporia radiculosa]|uniref:Rho-GAP domain-containing protein n=1 Tax=Fibroporia radiculosa TaxID=599839 RepID=J4I911_9APHY|nr:uncharacterized protein FIBRA_02381 [Fibroporia radiculosa]CCM00351.1 predicted protein [Fibroporia radiculosa]